MQPHHVEAIEGPPWLRPRSRGRDPESGRPTSTQAAWPPSPQTEALAGTLPPRKAPSRQAPAPPDGHLPSGDSRPSEMPGRLDVLEKEVRKKRRENPQQAKPRRLQGDGNHPTESRGLWVCDERPNQHPGPDAAREPSESLDAGSVPGGVRGLGIGGPERRNSQVTLEELPLTAATGVRVSKGFGWASRRVQSPEPPMPPAPTPSAPTPSWPWLRRFWTRGASLPGWGLGGRAALPVAWRFFGAPGLPVRGPQTAPHSSLRRAHLDLAP